MRRPRRPVTWAWACSAVVAVFAAVLFAAPLMGVERWHVIAAALPARAALGAAFAVALVVALVGLCRRTWRPQAGVPVAVALALATALHLPVVLARGVVGEPVAAPAAGQLRLLEWNTNTDLTTPDVVAELAAAQDADVVVLPEVAPASGSTYRQAFAAAGDPLVRVDRHTSTTQVAVWMAPQLARHYATLPGPDPVKTVELRPDTASLPTVLALHAPWPVGARLAGWDRDVDWVAAQCSAGTPVLVAGDFNASTDDFGGARLGRCLDAATQQQDAGVGTWSTHLPTLLAMPIDHVLATPSVGTVTSFSVLTSEDGSGTRHRPTMTVVAVADRP
ncbi:endonuclease/exonuclease/phosphatase family protein [Streptomyces sp. NP160]|uniref:endonuclease/exonuclease/phosphatase family protein n=1 Tax=Streptomyces sp. NP160 TaxID=2586637 RepID=UPI00111B5290|nr:endonuclease/exonuclease/phosphatase family protein [Streptomyces sp. NP160]TNM59481.1 endonuclease/exonuclease/phosphatase family protein [Streptomyces sp. NP160]